MWWFHVEWVKTKRKSEYPKGELPSRRTNWCQFVHHSQAEEQDVSLHWWNLDLEFDEFRDMFTGDTLGKFKQYIYNHIHNVYVYIYIVYTVHDYMYKSYISSNGYEQIFGVGFSGNRGYIITHGLWLLKREARLSTMRFWVDPMCKEKHISGWWFQPTIWKTWWS